MTLFSFSTHRLDLRSYLSPLLLIVCPLPLFFLCVSFVMQMNRLDVLESKIEWLRQSDALVQSRKENERSFLEKIKRADRFYMNKYIETLPFLEQEVKKLQMLNSHGDNEQAKQRLHFLTKGGNRLQFQQVQQKKSDVLQESELKQSHPVEMNEGDLKRVLSLIEGISIGNCLPEGRAPQIVIKDFQLTKKNSIGADHVYSVMMQLIKRESAE